MKIAIVFGTRPEIIKMYPIIEECKKRKVEFFVVHSGQHYSFNMDKVFLDDLNIENLRYNLEVGSGTHGKVTSRIIEKCEEVFIKENPSVILVQGDTNTVVGAAIAASKLKIPIGHVEAGLRSGDRNMPEEINRIITDHISRYCFAPTVQAFENLKKEGLEEKSFITGNTIVDAIKSIRIISERKSNILERLNLSPKGYILVTSHREENVDNRQILKDILESLVLINQEFHYKIIFPIHPRTRKRIEEFGLALPKEILFAEPIGYLDFIKLESNAKLILTDSGGIQEESCILGVPCVTLRENTERPETLEVGSNILVGTTPYRILEGVKKMIDLKKHWTNPFGNGDASERIIKLLLKGIDKYNKNE